MDFSKIKEPNKNELGKYPAHFYMYFKSTFSINIAEGLKEKGYNKEKYLK